MDQVHRTSRRPGLCERFTGHVHVQDRKWSVHANRVSGRQGSRRGGARNAGRHHRPQRRARELNHCGQPQLTGFPCRERTAISVLTSWLESPPERPHADQRLRARGGKATMSTVPRSTVSTSRLTATTRVARYDSGQFRIPTKNLKWPVTDRAKWLQTAANIFDLIYSGEDRNQISDGTTFTATGRSLKTRLPTEGHARA